MVIAGAQAGARLLAVLRAVGVRRTLAGWLALRAEQLQVKL